MEAIETARLRLRPFRNDPNDAAAIHAIRNDPTSARWQSWTLPYSLEAARSMVGDLAEMDGPVDGEWFGLAVTQPGSDTLIGDVVIRLEWNGRAAEIGYTLAPAVRGQGFATEACGGVLRWLFEELGVKRVHASLHPDNVASARVLERLGFLFEGTSRQAYWVGDECSDDPHYGLLLSDWHAWTNRPSTAATSCALVALNEDNIGTVAALQTHHSQERFVSPMRNSFRDMAVPGRDYHGEPVVATARAIVADGVVVGFVLLAEPSEQRPWLYLWRLLIDRMHQRRGIGTAALNLVVHEARQRNVDRIRLGYSPGPGEPVPVYRAFGFVPTGNIVDGEVEMEFTISPSSEHDD